MRAAALVAAGTLLSGCSGSATHAAAPPATSTARPPGSSSHPASPSAASVKVAVTTVLHLPVGVSRTVLLASGGRLLALGGLAAGDTTTGRIWSINTANATARQVGTLSTPVHDASGAMLAGGAVVFGGGAATTVADVQSWNGRRTTTVGALPQPRSDSAAASIGTTAYVVGGFTGQGMARDVVATTDGQRFRVVARLRIGVRYPAVAAVGRYVYVVGGELATTEGTLAGGQTDAVQRIDPASGQVRVIGHLGRGLGHATAFAVGGRLFVAGGRHGATATADVIEVSIRNGAWQRAGRLPRAMSDAAAAVVGSVAWLVGGETSGPSAPVSSVLAVRVSRG